MQRPLCEIQVSGMLSEALESLHMLSEAAIDVVVNFVEFMGCIDGYVRLLAFFELRKRCHLVPYNKKKTWGILTRWTCWNN